MLTVVAEEILGKGTVENVAKLFGRLQVGFDIDTKPLEFMGLVAGADAQHQASVQKPRLSATPACPGGQTGTSRARRSVARDGTGDARGALLFATGTSLTQ